MTCSFAKFVKRRSLVRTAIKLRNKQTLDGWCSLGLENNWLSVTPRFSNTLWPHTSIFQEQVILLGSFRDPPKSRTQENNKRGRQRAEPLQTAAAGSASSSPEVQFGLVKFDVVNKKTNASHCSPGKHSHWDCREERAPGRCSWNVSQLWRSIITPSCARALPPSRTNESGGHSGVKLGVTSLSASPRLNPFLPVKLLPVLLRHPLDQRL